MISSADFYPPAGDSGNGEGKEQAIAQQTGADQPVRTEPAPEKPPALPEEPKCIPKHPHPKPVPPKKKERSRPVAARPAPRPATIETTGDSDAQQARDEANEPGNAPSGNTGQGGGSHAGGGGSGAGRPGIPGGSVDSTFGSVNGPRFANQVRPKYPSIARQLGKEGTVLLRLTIDERGRLVEVEILAKAGAGFEEEAVRAVRESTYLPARANGQPIKSRAVLPIRFVLKTSG